MHSLQEVARGWLAESRLPLHAGRRRGAQGLSAAGEAGASQGKRPQRAGKGKQQPPKQPAGAASGPSADGGSKAGTGSPAGRESTGGETGRVASRASARVMALHQFQSQGERSESEVVLWLSRRSVSGALTLRGAAQRLLLVETGAGSSGEPAGELRAEAAAQAAAPSSPTIAAGMRSEPPAEVTKAVVSNEAFVNSS